MEFDKKEIEKGRSFTDWLIPVKYTHEDDISYLHGLALKKDERFRVYRNTDRLYNYLSEKAVKHESALFWSKVADTADKAGILCPLVFHFHEETAEIAGKLLFLYPYQKYSLKREGALTEKWKKKTFWRYVMYEAFSLIPFVGEIADWRNIYVDQMFKGIAEGISYDEFESYNSNGELDIIQ